MRYYNVMVSSSNGNILSCNEITETQYNASDQSPQMQYGTIVIRVPAKNPKDAQNEASKVYRSIKAMLH